MQGSYVKWCKIKFQVLVEAIITHICQVSVAYFVAVVQMLILKWHNHNKSDVT